MVTLSLMAAMSKNRVIGKDNKLPWRLPSDLKNFKNKTVDKIVVMGRKTYESIGKPLPKRLNIIISKNMEPTGIDLLIYQDLESGISAAKSFLEHFKFADEVVIIGGAQVYEQALPLVDRMYLSKLEVECDGDTFFPEFNNSEWETIESSTIVDEKSYLESDLDRKPLTYSFETLERKK